MAAQHKGVMVETRLNHSVRTFKKFTDTRSSIVLESRTVGNLRHVPAHCHGEMTRQNKTAFLNVHTMQGKEEAFRSIIPTCIV